MCDLESISIFIFEIFETEVGILVFVFASLCGTESETIFENDLDQL